MIQQGLLRENNIMGWVFRSARNTFDEYRERWDEINKRCGNHILLDSVFVGALIRHFASDQTLLGISNDDSKPGMLIVDKVRPGFWQTFQPSQGPLGLILLVMETVTENQMALDSQPSRLFSWAFQFHSKTPISHLKCETSRTAEICDYAADVQDRFDRHFRRLLETDGKVFCRRPAKAISPARGERC